ncbi:hypothetical protein EDC96DRAFT_502161 [Choanephora cucurbitarum]|nr:hypothetical protein EDC96DRAFT_502161 [Choanephora cucurbitarum]
MMEVDGLQEARELLAMMRQRALDLRREDQAKFKNGEPADDLLQQYMLAARDVEDLRRTSAIMLPGEMPRLMGPHEKPEGKYDGLFRNVKQLFARLERYAHSQENVLDAAHDKCLPLLLGNNYRVHYERQMVSSTANGKRVAWATVKSWLIEYSDIPKQRAKSIRVLFKHQAREGETATEYRARLLRSMELSTIRSAEITFNALCMNLSTTQRHGGAPSARLSQGLDSVPHRRGTEASRWATRRRRTTCDRCGSDYQPGHNRVCPRFSAAAIRVEPPAQEQEPTLSESRMVEELDD